MKSQQAVVTEQSKKAYAFQMSKVVTLSVILSKVNFKVNF